MSGGRPGRRLIPVAFGITHGTRCGTRPGQGGLQLGVTRQHRQQQKSALVVQRWRLLGGHHHLGDYVLVRTGYSPSLLSDLSVEFSSPPALIVPTPAAASILMNEFYRQPPTRCQSPAPMILMGHEPTPTGRARRHAHLWTRPSSGIPNAAR
jgi:hypothetical protein